MTRSAPTPGPGLAERLAAGPVPKNLQYSRYP